ncbi:MAG: hypothetical protein ACYC3I_20070 [Gemmataceae bacterium]
MKTASQALIYIICACLLLSWVGGVRRPLHRGRLDKRANQEHLRVLARVRRCRGDNSSHHPVRPSTNAVLPPDDDTNDPVRPQSKGVNGRLHFLCQNQAPQSLSSTFGSRPLPTEVPRHQTLCILVI